MDDKLLELLVCPVTKGPLIYDKARQELISLSARLAYPIRDGIPVMLEEEARSLDREEVESELLPLCLERGVTIQAYTPLERGAVSSDPIIVQVARKHEKTPVQVALNYLISQPRVIAIPKTEKRERVDEFLGALGWSLDEEDLDLIRGRRPA